MRTYGLCPNCRGGNLYRHQKPVSAGGGYAPNYLPGLGKWSGAAKFDVIVCSDCGLTRLFASQAALDKMRQSDKWKRVQGR